jgi:hypothetical protein
VVHVQHDAGITACATAVAAAEAVALQDREAQLRGEGIAGSRALCRSRGRKIFA